MKRNDFIVTPEGEVVCALCSGDCGQCGAGGHMNRCQEYVNANKEKSVGGGPTLGQDNPFDISCYGSYSRS